MRPVQALRLALVLLLGSGLVGCAHRLSGPIHSADLPPWVAEAMTGGEAFGEMAVDHRLVLIGDAGLFLEDDPTLAAVDRWATTADDATVVFLGDNIYNEGLTDEDRERGERILAQQLAATAARKIVVPGNHDWGLLPRNYNARAIENQQGFVDGWPGGSAEFVPKDGCMGPAVRVLRERGPETKGVVLVALDPTPWIQPRIREACPRPSSQEEHLAELGAALARHADDYVVVVSHYPMLTGGPHGGLTYGFVGDMIVTPLGWMMGGLLNTYEDGYADWIEQTRAVFERHRPIVYAAGHDHNLQLLDAGGAAGLFIVSGAGARDRVSTVTHLPETHFAHAAEGFVVVDFGTRDGEAAVVVRVVEPMVSSDVPVHEQAIPLD